MWPWYHESGPTENSSQRTPTSSLSSKFDISILHGGCWGRPRASATLGDYPHTKAFRTTYMLGASWLLLEPVFCSDIQAQKASSSLPVITWPLHRNHKILRSQYLSKELVIFPMLTALSLQTAMIQMSKGKHSETDF